MGVKTLPQTITRTKERSLVTFAWVLSLIVTLVAIIAWGEAFNWRLSRVSSYYLFPLFGLITFSLMWAHYIVAALRGYLKLEAQVTKSYFEVTSFMVLVFILLHPGLLIWQLWRDGLGTPPGSYYRYVGRGLGWVVSLGVVSLLIFLAYELRRKYKDRSWWRFMQYASDVAILAVFYHGLRLGTHVQSGWYQAVWYFYGVTLVGSLAYQRLKRTS